MTIYSIINQKGGTGKSTTAQALAAGLALKGYRVLCVDMDAQCNLSYAMGAARNGLTLFDVLSRRATAEQAIQHTVQGDIIPAGAALAAEDWLTGTGRECRMREALEPLQSVYDYTVIDCPPSLGILSVNALTASHGAIVPAQADVFSLQAIEQVSATFDAVKKYTNHDLRLCGLLITRYSGRAILSRDVSDMIENAARRLDTKVYTVKIRECIAVKEAQARRESIYAYAPRSNAAADYMEFVQEVLRDGKKEL